MPKPFAKLTIRKVLAAAFAFCWLAYFHFAVDWAPGTPAEVETAQEQ